MIDLLKKYKDGTLTLGTFKKCKRLVRDLTKSQFDIIDDHVRAYITKGGSYHFMLWQYLKGDKRLEVCNVALVSEIFIYKEIGLITEEEMERMISLLASNDEDNFFIGLTTFEYFYNNLNDKAKRNKKKYLIENQDDIFKNIMKLRKEEIVIH